MLSPIYATTTPCWIELFAISIAVYFPLSSVVTLYTLFPNVIVIVAFAIGFLFSSSKYPIIYILSPSFKGGLGIIDNVVFSLRTLNDVFIILGLCVLLPWYATVTSRVSSIVVLYIYSYSPWASVVTWYVSLFILILMFVFGIIFPNSSLSVPFIDTFLSTVVFATGFTVIFVFIFTT